MIKLEVEDYCQNCPNFEAKLEKDSIVAGISPTITINETIVRCKYETMCENMYRHIKECESS